MKIQSQIRPGVESDKLVIPVYQGENDAEGTSAIYNDHVADIEITGDDVPSLIAVNSLVDISLKVDKSQMMTCLVTFKDINETISKEINIQAREGISSKVLDNHIKDAKRKLRSLKSTSAIPKAELVEAEKKIADVEANYEGKKNSEDGKMSLLRDLRLGFLEMEKVEKNHEWEALESELREEFERLEDANNDLGNKHDEAVEELRRQTDNAIRSKDVKMARAVLHEINELFIAVTFIYQLVGVIRDLNDHFNTTPCKDSSRARQLLNKGIQMINNNEASVKTLHPICVQVLDLMDMPENQKPSL